MPNSIMQNRHGKSRHNQRGVAFLLLVVTLVLGAAAIFYGLITVTPPEIERDRKTTEALTIAKAALIGHAISQQLYSGNSPPNRLGDLPCPDTNDSGQAAASCGDGPGSTGQPLRLGRLPWRTLGLPDLRDGDGERLWYAVSANFKNNTRSTCNSPYTTGCLNSDTRGSITVRNNAGTIIHDATNTDPTASGAIAVIFSPGAVIRRQDGVQQNRICTKGLDCDATTEFCTATTTPKCRPENYLDISGTEDNANFIDGPILSTDGFIHGIVRDGSGNVIVNDRLMVIRYQDVMPHLEKRVAKEVLNCLTAYASFNNGRYPWAALVTDVTQKFDDVTNTLFGRIPDQPLYQTRLGIVPATTTADDTPLEIECTSTPGKCMNKNWPATCQLPAGAPTPSWWNNWKLHVFYGLADAYKPMISYTQPTPTTVVLNVIPAPTGCPNCLTVDPPSAAPDKQVVVIVAGRSLPAVAGGQLRNTTARRRSAINYLEGGNDSPPTFTQLPGSTTFNDTVKFK